MRRNAELRHAAKGGTIAGIVAGIATALLAVVSSALAGHDIWLLAKMPAIPFLGDLAMQPGFDLGPVLLGGALHFAVSAGWGLLFGLLARGHGVAATLGLGVLWGVVVWFVMFQIVLPVAGATGVHGTVAEHLLFGATLALAYLPYQPRVPARSHPVRMIRLPLY